MVTLGTRSKLDVRLRAKYLERVWRVLLFAITLVPLAVTLMVIATLAYQSYDFFSQVNFIRFLTELEWEPLIEPRHFGILPLILGSLQILVLSLCFSLPIALLTAIYLSEFAPSRMRNILKPALEIIAGIPTVVFGFFALTAITPFLKLIFPTIEVFNCLSASLVVALMILPMLVSLIDDALTSIPKYLRDTAYGLGTTPTEVIFGVLLPAIKGRCVAAILLAASRALGETMAVTLAAGSTPRLSVNPLESIQTMTAYIVQVSLGDLPAGGIESLTTYAVALVLFIMCFFLNSFGIKLMKGDQLGA
jgi:phosphate transport system permease protein